jgi:hypothetical protein
MLAGQAGAGELKTPADTHALQTSGRPVIIIARHQFRSGQGSDMNASSAIPRAKTPWHLWAVGIVALLWNAVGAFDYLMTQTRNEMYMSAFTPEQLEYFYAFPSWAVAAWAIAVWGGVLGSILLLLRRQAAVWVFLASLVAMIFTTLYSYVLSDGLKVFGDPGSHAFSAVIFAGALGLFIYARTMQKRGVLR